MNSATGGAGTIGGLLFPEADVASKVQREMEERSLLEAVTGELEGLSPVLVRALSDEVADAAADLMEMDVVDVLVSGWKKYERLVTAARHTLGSGEEEIVELASHRITSTHRPTIDLIVDDVPVGTVELQIDLSAELHAVVAVVFEGRLMSLRSGRAEVAAELSCGGVPIKSAGREVDLAVELSLGPGLQLVEPVGYITIPDAPR